MVGVCAVGGVEYLKTCQKNKKALEKLYSIPESSGKSDPLNGQAMSEAKHSKDTTAYRGLASRSNEKERGRLAQFFFQYANSENKKIDKELYNAAIQIYHFNKDREKIEKARSAFKK